MKSDMVSPDVIRSRFARALSEMYRDEVPQYGTLLELVARINEGVLAADPALRRRLLALDELERISEERHGAIRLGTGAELAMMRRMFALMGMYPVGYYDLSVAGIPVHSTAFRPVAEPALRRNPFRVFTSLLRLELIADEGLRATAAAQLARRRIFSPAAGRLIAEAEARGGLPADAVDPFVAACLETFRWHAEATVPVELYADLHRAHRLVADVVAFKGPHINHLTPRTLDIDAVQSAMPEHGIVPKAVVEGPPARKVPILLRQTSFKALEESIAFPSKEGPLKGRHTARFGEIEQRGAALTPRGRVLYDRLLEAARAEVLPAADGSNAVAYEAALARHFGAYPDDLATLRREGLVYVRYRCTAAGEQVRGTSPPGGLEAWLEQSWVEADPIIYEDFLPVSAAGIFQSNLGDGAAGAVGPHADQRAFEDALGTSVADPFQLYEEIEAASRRAVEDAFRPEAN